MDWSALKGNAECPSKLLAGGADVEPLDQQGQVLSKKVFNLKP